MGHQTFYDESNRHNGGATSYPSHHHIAWGKNFTTFSILRGTCTIIQAHNFMTFLGIDYDEKWVSQINDDRIIVIRFMTKKYVFVAEDLLWHGIGDELIFVTQMSQIIKYDENTAFSDINETSHKPICAVVIQCSAMKSVTIWPLIDFNVSQAKSYSTKA
jgi:hypothetical protein